MNVLCVGEALWDLTAKRSFAGARSLEMRPGGAAVNVALALEACGFAERGAGVQLAREGAITLGGATPLATGGGCKARGDTVGANGVYQVAELVQQLRGGAGKAQVAGARVALAQCLGGIGATAATHILVAE